MSFFTDEQLNDAEEAVIMLSSAFGYSEKYIIDVLEDGFSSDGIIQLRVEELIDELRATFDAY